MKIAAGDWDAALDAFSRRTEKEVQNELADFVLDRCLGDKDLSTAISKVLGMRPEAVLITDRVTEDQSKSMFRYGAPQRPREAPQSSVVAELHAEKLDEEEPESALEG